MIKISQAVKVDSNAMKTIAILTLLFLPATFVSVSSFKFVSKFFSGNLLVYRRYSA